MVVAVEVDGLEEEELEPASTPLGLRTSKVVSTFLAGLMGLVETGGGSGFAGTYYSIKMI